MSWLVRVHNSKVGKRRRSFFFFFLVFFMKRKRKKQEKMQKASWVSPAVTRLTIYRRLQVCRARPKSNTDPSLKDAPVKTELFGKFDKFFWKSWVFMPLALPFGNFPFSGMSKQKRMQSGASVIRLYQGRKETHRWHTLVEKNNFFWKICFLKSHYWQLFF